MVLAYHLLMPSYFLVLIPDPLSHFWVNWCKQRWSQTLIRNVKQFSVSSRRADESLLNFDRIALPGSYSWIQPAPACQQCSTSVRSVSQSRWDFELKLWIPISDARWILSVINRLDYISGTLIIPRSLWCFLSWNSCDSAGMAVIQEVKWLFQRS